MWERRCANSSCRAEIEGCFGTVKAGDLLEYADGTRAQEQVRELCPLCATYLVRVTSGIPPAGWSPYFAALGFG